MWMIWRWYRGFLKQSTEKIKLPGSQVNVGSTIFTTLGFRFGSKLQMILEGALNIMQFYNIVGIYITNTIIQGYPIINDFKQEWDILAKRNGEDVSDVPNTRKALTIIKWTESFSNFLHRTVVERNISLYYVIRKSDTVTGVEPTMARGKSNPEKHGSVEKELIKISSNTHPYFKEDNSKVYFYIEEAKSTTCYAASINPLQNNNNGRDIFLAFFAQYPGDNK